MVIKIECRDHAVWVEDVEGGDVCLLELVPLAPGDDPEQAVAALSAEYAREVCGSPKITDSSGPRVNP